jgi:hypothetical protein
MNDLHADPDRTRVIESVQKKLAELAGTVLPAMRRHYRAASAAARRALRSRSKRTLRF